MSTRKRKVKYDGVRYGYFSIDFKAYAHVMCINLLLWLKRQYRRVMRAIKYMKMSLIIVPFWAIFVGLIYFLGQRRGANNSIGDILWDLKTAIFTSVVITAVTSFVSQYTSNKNNLLIQHKNYIELLHSFSELYDSLLQISGCGRKGLTPPFDPFYYSNDIYETTRNVFPKIIDTNNKQNEIETVQKKIDKAIELINKMDDDALLGKIDGCKYMDYSWQKSSCKQSLESIEAYITNGEPKRCWDNIVFSCVSELYKLLELVRKPWRRDLKYKLNILKTIYEQDKTVACTYYLEAFLGVVDYEFYNKTPKEIIEDLIRNNIVTDQNEEVPPGWVRVEITHRKAKSQPNSPEKVDEVTSP